MASTLHPGPPLHPPPSFSRNSTGSSMNGVHASFDASQSVASTPAATPPPPRGHHQRTSFNMGSHGQQIGMVMQRSGFMGFGEVNGHIPQQQYPPGHKPQIYTAVYSGVSVYEMEVNNIAVMRRRSDSWLNATQILKVAGIEKGKRTKVLEKEILVGEHEKVQGGYGKYQGTWINYKRGVDFCQQYGVEELLRPLLNYDMGQDGISAAGQGGVETPTKEQAMAAQRKRLYNGIENRPPGQSPSGTFFKNISSTAANAVSAMSKARFDSTGPRPGSGNRRPNPTRRSSQQIMGSQESTFPGSSQQSMQSLHSHSESSFGGNGQLDSAYGTQNGPYFESRPESRNGEMQEPPRKRMRPSSSHDPFIQTVDGAYDVSMRDTSPTEPNESFVYDQRGHFIPPVEYGIIGLDPLPQAVGKVAEEKHQLLTSLFLDPSQTDFTNQPALSRLSGQDLDIPLDNTAHTALHWAATLARTSLLKALIARGASIFRLNGGGETALMRACVVTNNLDQGSFPELLEMLGPTIEMRDGRGRTVLHHIAVSSAVKGRSAASRYYLESLLEFVVRQGSVPSSQQNSFNGGQNSVPVTIKSIGLARFMSEIVNARDKSGDTALNLAARIGNKSIIQQLLEVGADPGIANRGGLRPMDFGIGSEPDAGDQQVVFQASFGGEEKLSISKAVGETSRDIMSSISSLLSQTEDVSVNELRAKHDLIDQAHIKLRECSAALGEERRRLEKLRRKAEEAAEMKQNNLNLKRSADEQGFRLHQQKGMTNGATSLPNVRVGEADAGLQIQAEELPDPGPINGDLNLSSHLTEQQYSYFASLPQSELLRARLSAYREDNQGLRGQAKQLKSRSSELEEKYRRVVALCTGVEESKVEELLGSLVAAVESEKGEDVEVGRVREFLRRVEGVEP
ncbi:MAG: transcriptional regulator swi6 [Pleopsidium flavum]|nr:MAG: transcriptional regulator swi6 [Pleopsidium flavum]